jgi:hypothetical protein
VPTWEETLLADVYADVSVANSARVVCTYGGETHFLGWAFGGTVTATAMKRMEENPDDGFAQLKEGSALCQ